jgi:hypothetical protein
LWNRVFGASAIPTSVVSSEFGILIVDRLQLPSIFLDRGSRPGPAFHANRHALCWKTLRIKTAQNKAAPTRGLTRR